ncbi:hypothetical protein [Merismopedia glauca]|uniref:Uncharacterized protein n=1 Tax=Merismopedia glauca CCAP 1448/3 TaxID=1296344 RepID=A0A2T1BY96_9CYAN|nr:hypothetical protein [Merismopedia glauca]PSB00897.1 hypothetical protein C7B64_21100 [Merismopedia glauca CCAP 1448/3]
MKLLVINTIGLTGVEVLASEMSLIPGIAFLPGQNFIQFDSCLYRPHNYSNLSPEDIFASLSRHQYTKAGRCWAGLTKHMSEEQKRNYDLDKHQMLFVNNLSDRRDIFSCIKAYILTFFEVLGIDISGNEYLGFWGANFVLSYGDLPLFSEEVKVINWSASIDLWLAMISSAMTWNCIEACKFWIINSLFLANSARNSHHYLDINRSSFISNKEEELQRIKDFLNLNYQSEVNYNINELGFIKYNPMLIESIQKSAADIRTVYADNIYFKMAENLAKWQTNFLEDPKHQALLQKYQKFWHSTAHTNFDWVDPIAEEIIELAVPISAEKDTRNFNCNFYHQYSSLCSDNHSEVVFQLEHYLGSLEEEIVIPKMPYFLKIILQYLSNIANNYIKQQHSYVPIRQGNIYQRLSQAEYQDKIVQFGLKEKMLEVEQLIDETEKIGRLLANN